ncbi:uncharacterized protein G2W53_004523 [Senna tora]|uniref:Uncharacterized protein n=1 Tax=Senna tora TaxID=362788 RepID=A0A834XD28_9FABA|nr:uncharacterized protein G2W53_004523 [Senna tora]
MAKQKGRGIWMSIGRAWIQGEIVERGRCGNSASQLWSPNSRLPLLSFPALHLLYVFLTCHHHSFVIVIIIAAQIHHRCRRDPSSSLSRSIIVTVKIRHHCHRDPSSSPSRSIIVVNEIRHCRCRDPSPLSLRSVTIAVDVVEHGRSGPEAQTSYG